MAWALAVAALIVALAVVLLRALVGVVPRWSPRRADRATAFLLGWVAVGCLVGLLAASCSAFEYALSRERPWRRPYPDWIGPDKLPTPRSVLFVLGGVVSVVCLALLAHRKAAGVLSSRAFLACVLVVAAWWFTGTWLDTTILRVLAAIVALFVLWVRGVMIESRPLGQRPSLVPTPPST